MEEEGAPDSLELSPLGKGSGSGRGAGGPGFWKAGIFGAAMIKDYPSDPDYCRVLRALASGNATPANQVRIRSHPQLSANGIK